jgi:hypothetical protein
MKPVSYILHCCLLFTPGNTSAGVNIACTHYLTHRKLTCFSSLAEDEKTFLLKKLIALKLKSKKKVVNPIAPPPPVVPTGPVTPPPPPPREVSYRQVKLFFPAL